MYMTTELYRHVLVRTLPSTNIILRATWMIQHVHVSMAWQPCTHVQQKGLGELGEYSCLVDWLT